MSTYIIAEAGSVADGSLGNMLALVDMAAQCGADAFKGQCHFLQRVSGPHPSPYVSEKRDDYYQRTGFCREEWLEIRAHCKRFGLDLIVSPFSMQAVSLVNDAVDAWKIASGEVTNRALLEAVAATGKPVHLSSGMTADDETWDAASFLRAHRVLRSVMLCTSEYPCSPENTCLRAITHWKLTKDWDPPTHSYGFSDHTLGFAASLAAITLGATVIERHVTLSRRMYGSDAAHSLEPDEFARFVREVRELDRMLASPVDKDELVKTPEIQRMREVFLCR